MPKSTAITNRQLDQLERLTRERLRKIGATQEGGHTILQRGNAWLEGVEELYKKLSSLHIVHHGFRFLKEFPVDVPADVTVDSLLGRTDCKFNTDLNAKNFPKSGIKAGRRYICEVYFITRKMNLQKLIEIGKKSGHILGGALGAALVSSSEYRQDLPNTYLICVDSEKNLWRESNFFVVPYYCDSDKDMSVGLFHYDLIGDPHKGFCVPYFRDVGPLKEAKKELK